MGRVRRIFVRQTGSAAGFAIAFGICAGGTTTAATTGSSASSVALVSFVHLLKNEFRWILKLFTVPPEWLSTPNRGPRQDSKHQA